MRKLLAALLAVPLLLAPVPAAADYQIPAVPVTCAADSTRLHVERDKVWLTGRLTVGGVNSPQHFVYATWLDMTLRSPDRLVSWRLFWRITDYPVNTDECVIAKVRTDKVAYHRETRAVVTLYQPTGDRAGRFWYYHLRRAAA